MNHPEESNEDIQREAQRLQGRSNARRKQERTEKRYKKASRGVLAGTVIAASIAGGSYLANRGESSPTPVGPAKEKTAGAAQPEASDAPAAETVVVPVTSVEGDVDQPIAVSQVVEFDAEGRPIAPDPNATGGVSPEAGPDLPDSRTGGTPAP